MIPAIASMIRYQKDDEILRVLYKLYNDIKMLNIRYIELKDISKKEYNKEFRLISKEYNKKFKDRFNLNIVLKSSNIFAVIPLHNTTVLDKKFAFKNDDIKVAIKQIKEFSKYVKENHIELDLENVRVNNLPKDIVFPLYIDPNLLDNITEREFAAIILHEVGHIFTLLEMYSNTNLAITSMSNALIENGIPFDTLKLLKIGNVKNDTEAMVKIYEEISNNILGIKIAGNRTDSTDIEYEADNFAVKFGLGDDLITALNKLMNTKASTYTDLYMTIGLITALYSIITYTILSFIINPAAGITITLFTLIAGIVNRLTNALHIQLDRNPNNDEHGSIGYRFKKIRLSLINSLRTQHLTKSEQQILIHQLDTIDTEINVLEKSFLNSILGGMLFPAINTNVNIQDRLALILETMMENDLYVQKIKLVDAASSHKYHGRKEPFIKELEKECKRLKENSLIDNINEFYEIGSNIEDIIYERFGIPVFVIPAKIVGLGFACVPFTGLKDTGLSNTNYVFNSKLNITNINAAMFIEDINNGHKITIDTDKTYIKGMDRERHSTLLLVETGRDAMYLNSKNSLTPLEMVYVILHEIGHLYTYIESISRYVHTNTLLQDSLLEYNDSVSDITITSDERFKEAGEALKFNSKGLVRDITYILYTQIDIILNSLNLLTFKSYILTSADIISNKQFLGGYNTYKRDSENVADNLSVMFGGGDELATALNKMITFRLENKALILLPIYINNLMQLTNLLHIYKDPKLLTKLPLYILYTLKYNMLYYLTTALYRYLFNDNNPYDKLPQRLKNMKKDLIKATRGKDLTKAELNEVVKSIERINENVESVIKSGYESTIFSMFIPNSNIGTDVKVEKRYTNILDDLINNDLHFMRMRFMANNASNTPIKKVYVTDQRLNASFILFLKQLRGKVDIVNNILVKYDIVIDIKDETLIVESPYKLKIKNGISTISLVPTDDIDRGVINITTEMIKIGWHLATENVEVYDIDVVQLDRYKTLYIEYMKHYDFNHTEKLYKNLDIIHDLLNKHYDDYGTNNILDRLDLIIKSKKVDKDLVNKFKSLKDFFLDFTKKYDLDTSKFHLDIHSGNILYQDNEFILLDPIYHPISNARKQRNYIEIDRGRLAVKSPYRANIAHSEYNYKNDDFYKIYHYGKKGYDFIKTNPEYRNTTSFFLSKLGDSNIKKLLDNGFTNYENIESLYTIDLRDLYVYNKDIKIQLFSTPEESEYLDKYLPMFKEKYKHLSDTEYNKQITNFRNTMHKTLYGKEYFSIDDLVNYIATTDYLDIDKYVDINIEKGDREQYATYIPHIQIFTAKEIPISTEERI